MAWNKLIFNLDYIYVSHYIDELIKYNKRLSADWNLINDTYNITSFKIFYFYFMNQNKKKEILNCLVAVIIFYSEKENTYILK